MAGFVPLKAKIAAAVAAAVAVVGPDDGGRALPTAAGLAVADASGPRCGGAAGELDAVDFGSTLMCGSFGRTGRTASGCVFFMCRSMLPRSTYDLLHCGQ
uniref:Putative secreted protein n=1 Tax=Anopheles marajoara TaxID=58244 RepID=A0A2M4C916_9DIPT